MHEVSLVRNIFRTLEDQFSAEELASLQTIELEVGKLANVEPILMQSAFSAVQESDERYQGVRLDIEVKPILIFCQDCQAESEVQQFKFACAHCGQPNNNVVQGTELLIRRVHFEETPVSGT